MKLPMLVLSLLALTLASEKTITSEVVKATVFKDRALVTRSAEVELSAGLNSLVFSGLTPDLDDESVSISSPDKGVKIVDVKVERRFSTEARGEKVRRIQEKLAELEERKIEIDDKISVYESKKDFIFGLKAEALKYVNQKILLSTASTEKWNKMLRFVESNLEKIYSAIRQQNSLKKKLNKEIVLQQRQLNQLKNSIGTDYKVILVKLESAHAGKFRISPAYIIPRAGWYPVYDTRISLADKKIELAFFGMVHQSSGEDWRDVRLTLSTADPLSVKDLPQPETWFLDTRPLPRRADALNVRGSRDDMNVVYKLRRSLPSGMGALSGYVLDEASGEPLAGVNVSLENTNLGAITGTNGSFYIDGVAPGRYTLRADYIGYADSRVFTRVKSRNETQLRIRMAESNMEREEAVVAVAERPLIQKSVAYSRAITTSMGKEKKSKYSNIRARELSTTFELKTKNSIPGDNSAHKVSIDIRSMPVTFEYTTAPRLVEKVYLKGKAVNREKYPWLPGDMNIYVDNNFVNKTYIPLTVPTDTLEIALGTDDGIPVRRILKKRFTESKGILGRDRQITYTYEIEVKNNRRTAEEITVMDQAPVSLDERIVVGLINPEAESPLVKDDHKIVWKLKLKPGEKKILPLKFTVRFPAQLRVSGLE